jgi:hypothetical protein
VTNQGKQSKPSLPWRLGDSFDRLPFKRFVFREFHVIDIDHSPSAAGNTDARFVVNRFGAQLLATVAVGEHLLAHFSRAKHRHLPGRKFVKALGIEQAVAHLERLSLGHGINRQALILKNFSPSTPACRASDRPRPTMTNALPEHWPAGAPSQTRGVFDAAARVGTATAQVHNTGVHFAQDIEQKPNSSSSIDGWPPASCLRGYGADFDWWKTDGAGFHTLAHELLHFGDLVRRC